MDGIRSELKVFLLSWLDSYWPGNTLIEFEVLVMLWLALFTALLGIFLHGYVFGFLSRFTKKADQRWQRLLATHKLYHRAVYVFQGIFLQVQAGLWLDSSSSLLGFIKIVTDQWILLFGLLAFFSVLDFVQSLANTRTSKINFPLRGLAQTVKLIASVFVGVLAISVFMGKSPIILLSGLGALSAVLMLVFKDPIQGLSGFLSEVTPLYT